MNSHPVMALEQSALARWCNRDPDGFLAISARDVVYFDPFIPDRLDGLDQLKAHYDKLRGKIFSPQYEMIRPHVQETGNAAVLTFQFISYNESGSAEQRWNCTEVYRKEGDNWSIIQTHWSFTAAAGN